MEQLLFSTNKNVCKELTIVNSDVVGTLKSSRNDNLLAKLLVSNLTTVFLSALSTMLGVRMHLCTTFILLLILLLVLSLSCILYALWYSGN